MAIDSNPIKYSDLVSPDNSIQDLIRQLNELIEAYKNAKAEIQGAASSMAKSLGSVSGATEEQREEISKIAVESEKLARAYENIDNAQRKAYREQQATNQALKEQQRIDKLIVEFNKAKEGSYNRLSAQYRLNKIRLNEMSLAEREGTEAGRQLVTETRKIYEEMSRLQKETGKYTLEVGHYENALKRLPGPLGSVVTGLTQMRTGIVGIAKSDLPLGAKAIQTFGTAVAGVAGIFVMLARYVSGAIRTLRDFEQANANLSTILGVSRDEMAELTRSAQQLGRTTEYTASQVTELQTNLARLGFGEGQILAMQKSVLQFATAIGANLGEAAEVAGSTLRAFNLTSADTEDVLATLAVATNNSALNFEKIKTSIGTVFPVANAFGISVKDTTALLGALANAGFDASTAATATRNILLNLADANGKLAQRLGGSVKSFDDIINGLQKLRSEGVNVSEALELTDRRSVSAFTSFLSGVDSAKALRESLEDVSGELERISSERLNTLEGSSLILKSAWEGLTLSFQESNGIFKDTVDWLTRVVQWTQKLLFPAQTAAANWSDQFTEQFNKIVKDSDSAQVALSAIADRVQGVRNQLRTARQALADASPFTAGKRAREVEDLEAQLEGALRAQAGVQKMLTEQEAERQRQAAATLQTQKEEQEKLTKEQEKAAKKAAAQRLKDRQAVINAINYEIAATEKGTQEMLDLRLDKVEAERQLELERNRQAAKTAKLDEKVINAKYDAEAKKTREEFDKEVAALNVQRLQAEQQAIQLQLAVTEKGTQEELALRIAANTKAMEIELEQNRAKTEAMQQDEQAIKNKYHQQALRIEADFQHKIAQRNLEATRTISEQKFAMLDKNERQKTEFRLDQEKARLEAVLRLNEKATDKLTDLEIEAIKKTIEGIENEKKRLGFNNIYELLGISLSSEQQSAINTALDSVRSSIGSLIDTWRQAADAARSTADAQVEAAQKMLDAEIEARQQGYASREEYARRELALAKSQQEAAIEEQQKAQRAQESIDTLTQSSSLVTASANLWKSLSGIPTVGPALAIAAIATMWGSFAAAKIRARQLTTEKYGEGTVELLQGGSHASGHDIDLGTKPDGTRRRAEGGEYFAVINRRNSRKYGAMIPEVINSLNDGTFSDKFARAGEQMAGAVLNFNGGADTSRLERDVRAIREQGDVSRTAGDGYVIERRKNLIRKIKVS